MIKTHHREKLINAIIYFARNTNICGKTKLMKLLYFLDFKHFKQTGKSVTGLNYYAWEMGPVPRELFEEIDKGMMPDLTKAIDITPIDKFQKIQPKQKFSDAFFSNREMKLLEEISFIFRDAKAEQMVESTHLNNEPWDRTLKEKGKFQEIDYMLAIDSQLDSMPASKAKERMEEISEMHSIFGTR